MGASTYTPGGSMGASMYTPGGQYGSIICMCVQAGAETVFQLND